MKQEHSRALLLAALDDLAAALEGLDEGRLESIEAFCSRFARTVDLVVNKVLRSLDRLELLPQGTLLDVVNRAEKRGFTTRAGELREMKDVRNIIAHDYAGAKMAEIFVYCREQKPVLDALCESLTTYAHTVCRTEE